MVMFVPGSPVLLECLRVLGWAFACVGAPGIHHATICPCGGDGHLWLHGHRGAVHPEQSWCHAQVCPVIVALLHLVPVPSYLCHHDGT